MYATVPCLVLSDSTTRSDSLVTTPGSALSASVDGNLLHWSTVSCYRTARDVAITGRVWFLFAKLSTNKRLLWRSTSVVFCSAVNTIYRPCACLCNTTQGSLNPNSPGIHNILGSFFNITPCSRVGLSTSNTKHLKVVLVTVTNISHSVFCCFVERPFN